MTSATSVTSVSRGFEEIFSDYHLNPALFSSIKSGLNEGWIKREYINKKLPKKAISITTPEIEFRRLVMEFDVYYDYWAFYIYFTCKTMLFKKLVFAKKGLKLFISVHKG